jgi:hypothetical protein
MKRVKAIQQGVNRATQGNVRQSLLLTGLVLASAGAQASVTITTGNGFINRIEAGRLIFPPIIELGRQGGSILIAMPGPFIPSPTISLNTASASSSVNGSMIYTVGSNYGSFSENDSSSDGAKVELDLRRKGYGYHAEASSQTGLVKARAETQWVSGNSNGNSYNSGNSSASANASWSDWFVISGGTGLGSASFASTLTGVLNSAKNGSAGYSLNIGYSTNAYCNYWYNTCGESDQNQTLFSQTSSLSGKGKSTLSQEIEGEFTFKYDTAFQLTALLNVNAANGGIADFTLTSLGDSLVLPQGSSLLNASGLYVQAVPEADTYAMMLVGLGLVGWAATYRRTVPK